MTEWTPIVVALVAATPILLGLWLARRPSRKEQADTQIRETELAVQGLVALISELQEERSECQRRLQECLDAHRKTTAVDA